jgi:solute carrier family 35 protein E1
MAKSGGTMMSMIGLFAVWYGFNAGYNVYNSKLKGDLALPIAISISQLLVGLLYALPLWITGVRKAPSLTLQDLVRIFPVAALNAVGHCTTVVATFQIGGGSFTHVIKASEPVVSTILALFINGAVPPPLTGLSLLPITYGVAYASTLGNLSLETMSRELTTKAAM